MKNFPFAVLLIFSLPFLAGCGSATEDEQENSDKKVLEEHASLVCVDEYVKSTLDQTLGSCLACHVEGAPAESTRFLFEESSFLA
jgi:hypothetical protein